MNKQALLIGINQYQNLTELKYARQDAEAVADALKQNYCFSDDEIILLTDAKRGLFFPSTKGVIQRHLEDLIQQKHEFDLFIFGFWGHGLYRSGERYLCPQAVMDEDVCELGLSIEALKKQIINVKAKNTCMIFDCCQTVEGRGSSETLSEADLTIMDNVVQEIVQKRKEQTPEIQSNVAILNSCSLGQRAYEWDDRHHGIFTAHLLDALNCRYNSISSLISYVGKHVKQTAQNLGKVQKPYFTFKGDIDFPLPALSPKTGDVFISYRSHHIKKVEPILEELSKRGISYYIDRERMKSGRYGRKLTDAIKACKVLLLFWTEDVNNSDHVIDEIVLAHDWKKEIVPYKIGDFDCNDQLNVIFFLKGKHMVDNPNDAIKEVVDSVEQALKEQTSELNVNAPSIPDKPKIPSVDTQSTSMFPRPPKSEDIVNSDSLPIRDAKFNQNDSSVSEIKAGYRKTIIVNDVEFAFRWCPPGTFIMGSPLEEYGRNEDEKQHQVTLTKGFWLMETQVTVGMFKAFVSDSGYESKGNTPRFFNGNGWQDNPYISWYNPGFMQNDNYPVTCVSWNDAVAFCEWLSKKTGQIIQLPTEAQWEYACRSGTTGAYAGILDEMCWYNGKSGTHPVGMKKPNAWGLYDMHGNVWEWCQDWKVEYPSGSVTDPVGAWGSFFRINRGGNWISFAGHCRSAYRGCLRPEFRTVNLGFRCEMLIDSSK